MVRLTTDRLILRQINSRLTGGLENQAINDLEQLARYLPIVADVANQLANEIRREGLDLTDRGFDTIRFRLAEKIATWSGAR
jgi:hypothetical protein